jgi:rare lipoprotein A
MTAAHKTLPLPSYVRVTNLDNYRTAIVRVNDRGPFHDNRIIDLSYSAAYKLGVFPGGTGRVKLELISSPAMASQESFATPIAKLPDIPYQPVGGAPSANQFVEKPFQAPVTASIPNPTTAPVANSNASSASSMNGCYIQLIASSDKSKVQRLGNELQQQLSVPTAIETINGLFRLLAGPLEGNAQQMLETLRSGEYPQAYFTNKNLCG